MPESIQKYMWNSWWQARVEIIPDWMPNFPGPDTKPKLVVRYGESYLRYSAGPKQGFFWDIYPDAMHSEELAIIAVSGAPTPSLRNLMLMEGRTVIEINKEMKHA